MARTGIQLTRVLKALAGDNPHIPCSDDVRRHRSAGCEDPHYLPAARRILSSRRAAPAIPWHRQCAGATVRADHSGLAACAQAAAPDETATPESHLTVLYLRAFGFDTRLDIAHYGTRSASPTPGGDVSCGAGGISAPGLDLAQPPSAPPGHGPVACGQDPPVYPVSSNAPVSNPNTSASS